VARILVTETADADTADIISYLNLKAGYEVAAKYVAAFEEVYERLTAYPRSGPSRPILGPQVRINIVSPFVIIYEYTEANDLVAILRILHGHRKMSARLLLPEEPR